MEKKKRLSLVIIILILSAIAFCYFHKINEMQDNIDRLKKQEMINTQKKSRLLHEYRSRYRESLIREENKRCKTY